MSIQKAKTNAWQHKRLHANSHKYMYASVSYGNGWKTFLNAVTTNISNLHLWNPMSPSPTFTIPFQTYCTSLFYTGFLSLCASSNANNKHHQWSTTSTLSEIHEGNVQTVNVENDREEKKKKSVDWPGKTFLNLFLPMFSSDRAAEHSDRSMVGDSSCTVCTDKVQVHVKLCFSNMSNCFSNMSNSVSPVQEHSTLAA